MKCGYLLKKDYCILIQGTLKIWTKSRFRIFWLRGTKGTVCWIEVKVAVLCARQYMPWNLLIIKVFNIFLYFKHQILTSICSEAILKHNWRNCLRKSKRLQFQICFWANSSWALVFEMSKIIKKLWLNRSIFQGNGKYCAPFALLLPTSMNIEDHTRHD